MTWDEMLSPSDGCDRDAECVGCGAERGVRIGWEWVGGGWRCSDPGTGLICAPGAYDGG